jgi:hypothetical protein
MVTTRMTVLDFLFSFEPSGHESSSSGVGLPDRFGALNFGLFFFFVAYEV